MSIELLSTNDLSLVTGATGMLGSHIAEQLRKRDFPVRAICRPGSDRAFLESIGVETVDGDITDAASLRRACDGVHTVFHAAARVGDWGPWEDFVRVSIEGTRNVIDAAANADAKRLLHISSISAYGHPNVAGLVLDESAPLGPGLHRWSYYSRAKVEAEHIVWDAHKLGRIPVTVIRPSWLYGERDRATMPRLIRRIRQRKVKLIGGGDNRLNVVHAGNVGAAAVLAVQSERAIGEAYNCCHDGVLTQREYFNAVAEAIGEPEITKTVPYSVAYNAAFLMECYGHLFKTKNPPLVTRYAVWLMGRRCFFECNKVKEHLGWSSSVSYAEGIPAAVRDCLGESAPPTKPDKNPAAQQGPAVGAAS